MLVEHGGGSSWRTRLLLDQLTDPSACVPVDISQKHLRQTSPSSANHFPASTGRRSAPNFTEPSELPTPRRKPTHCAVFFQTLQSATFRRKKLATCWNKSLRIAARAEGCLIGIDLRKNVGTIKAAYNDSRGVTANFNLNLLSRGNCELGVTLTWGNWNT